MQFVIFTGSGIDNFIAVMHLSISRYKVEIENINADGFFQLIKHAAFGQLLGN